MIRYELTIALSANRQKVSKREKNWPIHEPRYRASTKIYFIIAIPFCGCQRNARKNITVTVLVRVSVTVRVSLV